MVGCRCRSPFVGRAVPSWMVYVVAMAPLLYQRNAITAFVVADANQNGFVLSPYM